MIFFLYIDLYNYKNYKNLNTKLIREAKTSPNWRKLFHIYQK